MATFRKVGKRWRAEVARKGIRRSKVCDSRQEARDWAAHQEHLILKGEGEFGPGTLGDLFHRYAREVSPKKRGERWEVIRLKKFSADRIAKKRLADLGPADFADWRDRRLKDVSPSSVNREMILMSAVLSTAKREWALLSRNPMEDVRKPRKPPPRDRRVSEKEIDALIAHAGTDLTTTRGRAIHAFRFAIETAMRAGEILKLRQKDITGNVARLHMTKNGLPRDVPLSKAALALWAELPGDGFDMKPSVLDVMFRRVRDEAGIKGLTFHDTRREAISRMAGRVGVLDLARIVGHQNLDQLRAYYNKSAADIADLLD